MRAPSVRAVIVGATVATLVVAATAVADRPDRTFREWVDAFHPRARAAGISDETWASTMKDISPDMGALELSHSQPEFNEALWQYLNRCVSDWRIATGK